MNLERLQRRTSSGRYIPQVDGIRFIAIGLVVVSHALIHATGRLTFLAGANGVLLFFVLSGFILGLPFVAGDVDLKRYYMRRLTRLEPPYIVALVLCFLLAPLFLGGYRFAFPHFSAGIVYSHAFVWHGVNPLDQPLWSLEIEIQFYLLLPLIARARPRYLIAAGVFFVAMQLVPGYCDIFRWSILGYAQFFILGLLLARVDLSAVRSRTWDVTGIASVIALALHSGPVFGGVVVPVFCGLILLSAFRGELFRSLLSIRFITIVGGMAYSIYLTHAPLMDLLVARGRLTGMALLAPLLVVAYLVGFVFYVLVERPCMEPDWPQRLRARLRRKEEAPTPEDPGKDTSVGACGVRLDLSRDRVHHLASPRRSGWSSMNAKSPDSTGGGSRGGYGVSSGGSSSSPP